MPELELQIGDDGDQIRITATFAITVDTALYVRTASLDRGDGVGHGHIRVVVRVDTEYAVEAFPDFRYDLHDAMGEIAAVSVAQAQNVRAGFLSCLQRSHRKIRIGVVAVEEMLGVVHYFPAMVLQILNGFRDQLEVLLFVDAQRALDVQVPALAENRNRGSLRIQQGPD